MNKMPDYIREISNEIEENEQLDLEFQDVAKFFAESMYADAIRSEIPVKHSARVSAEYKRVYGRSLLSKLRGGCLFESSLYEIVESTGKIVELDGKIFIVKSVFVGDNRDIKNALFNLAAKKTAQEMRLY